MCRIRLHKLMKQLFYNLDKEEECRNYMPSKDGFPSLPPCSVVIFIRDIFFGATNLLPNRKYLPTWNILLSSIKNTTTACYISLRRKCIYSNSSSFYRTRNCFVYFCTFKNEKNWAKWPFWCVFILLLICIFFNLVQCLVIF